jgi:uncharacterized iron-regulated protein
MQNFRVLFFMALLIFFAGCSRPEAAVQHTLPKACTVYDMKQAACIGEAALVKRLSHYRVLFVGDHHAASAMHEGVAKMLASLGRSGRRILLANEWFTPEDDALLSRYADGTLEGNFTEAVEWKKKAGYPFESYAPVYESVKASGGALYGINMDKPFQKALSDDNLSACSGVQRTFYDALDLNLTAHRALLAPFFDRCHAVKPGESSENCAERMYRVQVAWDTYMAQQSAKLADAELHTPDDLLVVFAGAMHLAYGVGINARFARLCDEPFVTVLPVPEGTHNADVGEADFLLFYPREHKQEGAQ